MDHELLDGMEDLDAISEINVTPFIDIMLVLLIVFMVTVPLMLGGVHVNLPRAQGERMNTQESPLIVTLDADNRVYVDEVMIPEDQYHATFQDLARKSENGEVFLRGDGEIKYARIMDLMADLGRAGFSKVVLVAELDEKSNGGKLPIRHQAQSR